MKYLSSSLTGNHTLECWKFRPLFTGMRWFGSDWEKSFVAVDGICWNCCCIKSCFCNGDKLSKKDVRGAPGSAVLVRNVSTTKNMSRNINEDVCGLFWVKYMYIDTILLFCGKCYLLLPTLMNLKLQETVNVAVVHLYLYFAAA